jgi:flagellar hook-length control protein FliK
MPAHLRATGLPAHHLPLRFGEPGWAHGFADRIAWLTRDGAHAASLRLHPPELGSIEVRITVTDQSTSISFSAPSDSVRDAIEAAVPRLRQLMTDVGVDLSSVDISADLSRRDQGQPPPEPWQSAPLSRLADGEPSDPTPMWTGRVEGGGLVDRYA